MSRFLYNLALLCLFPLIVLWLYWPGRKPDFAGRAFEHFGFGPRIGEVDLWVHAVSVGESMAAIALIKAWRLQYPKARLLLTTSSRTGYDRLKAAFGDKLVHCYAPYDFWPCVWLFFRRVKPKALWVMETELWPNWLAFCRRRDIPVKLVNARLSASSAKRYRRFAGLSRGLMLGLDKVLAQTAEEAARFKALGLPASKLTVTGSVKFDLEVSHEQRAAGQALAEGFGERPVWIAASTHQGEDTLMLAAHKALREQYPEALLLLVPRHPQRFDEVAKLLERQGWQAARRSREQPVGMATAVYLCDTMGEMMTLLAAAQVAVVAGSFVNVGGHNLLEPAAFALPTLTGPVYFNFKDITDALVAAGNCQVVSANELAPALAALFADPAKRQAAGQAGLKVLEANSGAIRRSLELLA
ncbi:lipid IV(A) 3-deoxy-D-manno-octulosonic acid transferase [Gallaecimonas pentaromativorans]|uniref:lipid IV(A) 3-deoxy-D-manno-octulosonic acid transferase n=1 Tax=Gallaecimonas pentaromativorans TaxID=584787 RepID=UPI00067EE346|nr:lipid IV(A) 3-deoxy-D-manno-octulosonic acid transferase [Gallaecimonas pentaromativorans]MED5524743.1 lipid IV(A) 3-deoxy-D-manno-octulosonic acid transferase [Pseudomonadota bacterium]